MIDTLALTEAGTVLGTASYISPEQAAGRPAGPASDVYSFGVILFRMLTGRLPFISTNAMELVRMHRDDEPPAVADVRPDVPPRLESSRLRRSPRILPTGRPTALRSCASCAATRATRRSSPRRARSRRQRRPTRPRCYDRLRPPARDGGCPSCRS